MGEGIERVGEMFTASQSSEDNDDESDEGKAEIETT